jgi:hypothetical protein
MKTDGVTMVRTKSFKIAGSLGLRQCAEREGITWDRHIGLHEIQQFVNDARVGPAFVKLACRMEIPWTVAKRGGLTVLAHQGFAKSAHRRFERT